MEYILPATVNDRRVHYFHLGGGDEGLSTFVVEGTAGRIPLLHLRRAEVAKALSQGAHDLRLGSCTVEANFDAASTALTLTIRGSSEAPATVPGAAPLPAAGGGAVDIYAHTEEAEATPRPKPTASSSRAATGRLHTLADALRPGLRLQWEDAPEAVTVFLYLDRLDRAVPPGPLHLHLSLRLQQEGEIAEAAATFFLAHPLQLVEAGIDFGSEASQAVQQKAVYRGAYLEHKCETVPLFSRVRALHPEAERGAHYVQQEEGNKAFYKSLFFVRKELESAGGAGGDFLPTEDQNLKMLVREDALAETLRDHYQLPNLKLVRKDGAAIPGYDFTLRRPSGTLRDLDFDDVREQAYASILKKLVAAWLSPELEDAPHPLYARLTLLVPNIYGTGDVHRTLGTLQAAFADLQTEELGAKLGGWEVQTISESDASFLGFYKRVENLPSGSDRYYIVIDCGKGTTDFSIMRTGAGTQPAEPLYRNGFAGAGNLISYAVFQTVMAHLAEVSDDPAGAARFIAETLPGSDPRLLLYLAREVERLKAGYREDRKEGEVGRQWAAAVQSGGTATFENLPGRTLADLVDLLRTVDGIYDWQGYIAGACDDITRGVVADLRLLHRALAKRRVHCAGVFLTGRGFLFEPLRRRLKAALHESLGLPYDAIREPSTDDEYKSICLQGVINSPFVLKPDIIGWPIQVSIADGAIEPSAPAAPVAKRSALGRAGDFFKKIKGVQELFGTTEEVENPDALAELLPDFGRHKLLIGDRLLRPAKPAFQQGGGYRYDMAFVPRDGFIIRRRTPEGAFDDWSRLTEADTTASHRQEDLSPSLFPANLPAAGNELRALAERHSI